MLHRRVSRKRPEKGHVFVAMPLNAPHSDELWEIIDFVCKRHELHATRADQFSRPREIMSEIREAIERAQIVIVDLTNLNANVLYELGFAHANCEAVLLVCNEGQTLPFDVAGLRFILFDVLAPAGKKKFTEDLWSALESIQAPDVPTPIRTKLSRTQSIIDDLSALASFPEDLLSAECVWFSGFLSTLAIGTRENFAPEDELYRIALLEEKQQLIELARLGCRLKLIITPPHKDDYVPERKDTAILRMEALQELLSDGDERALDKIEIVISPYRQKNLYIIGHICVSEGFKLGPSRGYDLTLRQGAYEAIAASIAAQSMLFEEFKTHTLTTYATRYMDSKHPLRLCVIKALQESLSMCHSL